MKSSLLLLVAAVWFAGCSQESDDKKSEALVKVEKQVEKSVGKDGALICLEEGGNITCKLMTKRLNDERSVVFHWHSPNSPVDDRERRMTLPANHASLFDLRNKNGRAKGEWKVTAELDGEELSTSFRVD